MAEQEIAVQSSRAEAAEQQLAARAEMAEQEIAVQSNRAEAAEQDAHGQSVRAQIIDQQLCDALSRLKALEASTSWRVLAPVRTLFRSSPRMARITRRSIKLLWWSITFQLPRRLRERRAIQQMHATRVSALQNSSNVVSIDFDADFYIGEYPDVLDVGMDPATHYNRHGRGEGRLGILPPVPGLGALQHLNRQRETVLVVCHEGSRTGAPILGFNLVRELLQHYNVVAMFFGPGPILDYCRELGAVVLGPISRNCSPFVADRIIAKVLEETDFRFAIINSVEARAALAPLTRRYVPTVSLLHEFAANTRPHGAFRDTVYWSGRTVFSSDLTRDNALDYHPELREIPFLVIPQGRCELPGQKRGAAPLIPANLRPANFPADGLVVVGLGTVSMRKGVDLFIDCAARVIRNAPDLPIRFVWVGKGYDPENDAQYSLYLADQIQRAGLAQRVHFIDELMDLQGVYAGADLLLLPSRLDPLPNVAIDALFEGLPVFCFDQATGIANILRDHGLAEHCVAPYLDTARMTAQLLAVARSPSLRKKLSKTAREIGPAVFDMPRYVERIIALADRQREASRQEKADISTIRDAGVLRTDYALPPSAIHASAEEATIHYVRWWASNITPRKPFPGFHPGIYRAAHGLASSDADPLADYLRADRPADGPWLLPVITPDTPARRVQEQRIALHVHAFYPDDVTTIVDALKPTRTRIDLLVSVVSKKDRERISHLLRDYQGGRVDIRVVPNRGRDIGPFCTAFVDTFQRDYDIVGHVHTKRSPDLDSASIQQWVHFLLTNLLGGPGGLTMADRILGEMAADPRIGLVFPDDPNVISWGSNRPDAEDLAKRMGITELPEQIWFPVGTMFWARISALEPLWALGLGLEDYPPEPVPYDGTMLHALERLLPLIAQKAGYSLAVTHVPRVTR
jgi:glycosyltransferase involved in cell wall biosynthesis